MDRLIEILEEITNAIIVGDTEKYTTLAAELSKIMWRVFPLIISLYSDERLSDIANDALYWPKQLEKIINVLLTKDLFKIMDILYYETRCQLLKLNDIAKSRNIDISF